MDTHATPAALEHEPGTTHKILSAIPDQGRQTLELVKARSASSRRKVSRKDRPWRSC
jgi:hypothetical protein